MSQRACSHGRYRNCEDCRALIADIREALAPITAGPDTLPTISRRQVEEAWKGFWERMGGSANNYEAKARWKFEDALGLTPPAKENGDG